VAHWRRSITDLRPTTLARLDATVGTQVLPQWGAVPLSAVTNADVRAWAARLHAGGLSASTVRKAVFALRRILAAAVADRRRGNRAALPRARPDPPPQRTPDGSTPHTHCLRGVPDRRP
jgi:site-specific recombinase XerC